MSSDLNNKRQGALYGLAFGDAWGAPTEFLNHSTLKAHPVTFPMPAEITDDTQMSLYVLETALQDLGFKHSNILQMQETDNEFNTNEVRIQFANGLLKWLVDPDNTPKRAPGMTCITALMAIENKHLITGLEGTVEQSKGNGANIRCPWLGLLNLPDNTIASLAVLQASVSHNHPLALAGAAVTSLVVSALLRGDVVPGHGALYQHAIAITERLINDQPSFWLGTNYSQGLTDLLAFLKKSGSGIDAFNKTDDTEDAADHLYQGWVAEEALVMAITIVDHYAGVPVAGMRRLVHSTGDTDSTGAIAGAFFGAAFGNDIWPAEWALNLEPRYAKELQELTVAINSQPEEYKLAE